METNIWPSRIDPALYPIHAYNQLLSPKKPEQLWDKLVRAEEWPIWYANCKNVRIISSPGPNRTLILGTKFVWQTFGLKVVSEIIEYRPYESIGWTAYELFGWQGYHGWRFILKAGGTLIVTEEVQKGPGQFFIKNLIKKKLETQHQNWLLGF